MPGLKSVKIDQGVHKRLAKMAETKGISLKDYLELVINYFYHFGFDPADLNEAGHSRTLQSIHKRTEFLVGFSRQQENDYIVPIKEMLESLYLKLDNPNGHQPSTTSNPNIQTEVNELIQELYEPGITCPMCNNPLDLTIKDDRVQCKHIDCDFTIPIVLGDIVLEGLDILYLLVGGMSRHFDGIVLEGEQLNGRLFLDANERYRLKVDEA